MNPGLPELLNEYGTAILTPEGTSPEILKELEKSPALQHRAAEVVKRAKIAAVLAADERLQLARANAQIDRTHIDGIGQAVASITKRDFNFLCWKHGPNWFRDPKTLRHTLALHPEMKVTSRSRKFSLRVNGLRTSGGLA